MRSRYPIDEPWIAFVTAWLDGQPRGTHARLAKFAGISSPTLNQLLTGRVRHSHAVPLINKMVGLPMPVIASGTVDEADAAMQLSAVMSQLDDDDAKLVEAQLQALLASARSMAGRSRNKGDA